MEIKAFNIFLNSYENALEDVTHWQRRWSWRLKAGEWVGSKHCLLPVLQGIFRAEGPGWYQTWSTGLLGMFPIEVGQIWGSASFNYGLSQITGEKEENLFYIKWHNEKSPLREYPIENSSLQILPLIYCAPVLQVISFSSGIPQIQLKLILKVTAAWMLFNLICIND